jgi:polyhydroxyalkanoate synthesis repressor PhaR
VQQNKTVVIRKYANRRLYNTASKKYVNLEDIAALVRGGAGLQVVDAQSGEDLTRLVLTQIIMEDAKGQPNGLPLELLRQLIVASDRAGREFIMWYLNAAFDAYHKVHDTLETRLEDLRATAMSPLSLVKTFFGGASHPEPGEELEQLRLRVAELEAALGKRRK